MIKRILLLPKPLKQQTKPRGKVKSSILCLHDISSSSPVIPIPPHLPWTHTCTHTRSVFLFHGLICLLVSLSASLCHASLLLSSFHSPLPPSTGFRWANFILVMPLVCNSQFGFSGKWPPLFIEGLFIWTSWLLCPNPEITFGRLWKGWCVSVIWCCLFITGQVAIVSLGLRVSKRPL